MFDGKIIKNIRLKKGISTYKLSELTGISQPVLSKLENNKRTADVNTLYKISQALGVPLNDLTKDVDIYSDNNKDTEALKKLSPGIEAYLRTAAKEDPIIADALKSMSESNGVLDLTKIIKKIIYNADKDILNIEFNDRKQENKLNNYNLLKETGNKYDVSLKFEKVPVLGIIRAGEPILAEQNIIEYIEVPKDMAKGKEVFGLKVIGDSMNNARIYEGDTVIVEVQNEVENGDIAVVLVDSEVATVKRFYKTDTTITLVPESTNPIHRPRVINITKTEVKILGKVIGALIKF